jgi:predicted TIM-barrel fold metal-dependent hydrolase
MGPAAPVSTLALDAHLHLWDTERLRYPWLDEVPLPRRVDAGSLTAVADLVFDVCVREPQLGEVVDLLRAVPDVRFVP